MVKWRGTPDVKTRVLNIPFIGVLIGRSNHIGGHVMASEESQDKLLERVDALQHELEYLKRGIVRNLATLPRQSAEPKPSLFGSVRGGDITEDMIEESKRNLFRDIKDI